MRVQASSGVGGLAAPKPGLNGESFLAEDIIGWLLIDVPTGYAILTLNRDK